MSEPGRNMKETSVMAQCLDLTKQLINTSTSFKFNFTTMDQESSRYRTCAVKKKSPSTGRRNAVRMYKFLEEKKKSSSTNEHSENPFNCDECDYKAKM